MLKALEAKSAKQLEQLPAGSMIDLEVIMPTTSKRIKTEYVGQLHDNFIIVNHPNPKRLGAAGRYVSEGTAVIVRALLEHGNGQVIAFKAKIKSVSTHPARLIFLNFPKQIQSYQLRAETRVPTLIPATLSFSGQEFLGVVRDMSLSGLQLDIETDSELESFKDQTCKILISGKDDSHLSLEGCVRRTKQSGHMVSLGIHLENSEQMIQKILQEYLIDLTTTKASPT